MLVHMEPSDWIALCAVVSGLLTSLVALWMNSRVTRRAGQQQAELLNRQMESEAIRSREERLWAARADVYANYLGWLRGDVRETLKYRLEGGISGAIPPTWWKTPYDLGNRMRLFESDAVHAARAALVQELAAIGEVMSLLHEGPEGSERSDVFRRLRAAASEAAERIDNLADLIRRDMQAISTSRHSQNIDIVEDLSDLHSRAEAEAQKVTQQLLKEPRPPKR